MLVNFDRQGSASLFPGYPWLIALQRITRKKVGTSRMPAPRNNKSKAPRKLDTQKTERSTRTSKKSRETGNELLPTAAPPPAPTQESAAWECDSHEELVLTFLSDYHAFEKALVRAGYTRAGRTPGSAGPDWSRFARHIQARFDPHASPVLQGAVAYMLWDEDNLELRNEQIENAPFWENPDPHNDTVWLSELVQQTSRKLIHSYNFPGQPGIDLAMVSAAMFIVEAWSHLDPEVESFIRSLQ
jgi:hypothetical protein